jgi:hypothetical protein
MTEAGKSEPDAAEIAAADAPVVGPRPLGGLADLADLLGGESAGSRRFLTGLIAGAIVGAIVAGGSLVRRRRKGRDSG